MSLPILYKNKLCKIRSKGLFKLNNILVVSMLRDFLWHDFGYVELFGRPFLNSYCNFSNRLQIRRGFSILDFIRLLLDYTNTPRPPTWFHWHRARICWWNPKNRESNQIIKGLQYLRLVFISSWCREVDDQGIMMRAEENTGESPNPLGNVWNSVFPIGQVRVC